MSCMRSVGVKTARVRGGAAAAGVAGGWGATGGAPLSWSRYTPAASAPLPSTTVFLRTPRRCASTRCGGGGGGGGDVSLLQKLKGLYREFQLSQDRKLDAIAAAEAHEGQSRFFDVQHRDDPRHPSSSGGRGDPADNTHLRGSPLIARNPNLCPRSVLFVPGSKPRAMEKITTLRADCFILDLEDSVGYAAKRQARENIRNFVEGLQKKRRVCREVPVSGTDSAILQKATKATEGTSNTDEDAPPARDAMVEVTDGVDLYPRLIVRINSPDFDPATAMLDLELVGLLGPAIEGVAIPKTTPRTYSLIKDYVHPNHQLWAFFESPKSVMEAPTICKQQVYQFAVMGYNDLGVELQLPMSSAPSCSDSGLSEAVKESLHIAAHLPLWQCTSQVLLAARAYNMLVLDAVFNDATDKAGFRRSLQECRALGLNGKTLIHPSQIEPTNAIYTPSEAEVAWATRIVEVMHTAQGDVATVDGKMVEDLHRRQAARVLALHRNAEAEKQRQARGVARVGETGEMIGEAAADGAREPRRTPSRHHPLH